MLNKKAMAAGNGVIPTDPDFEYVTMLLHGDGTNGAQNNTFIDGSTNNFTVTRNGNTTQGSLNPFGDRWSNYFDGSGDYLTVPSNTALAFGTGDFTVECWIYKISTGTVAILDYNGLGGFGFVITSTQITCFISQSTAYAATATVALNTWAHIAFARSGTTLKTYLNGVEVGSFTVSYNFTSPATLVIGRNAGSGLEQLNGYISNLRLVKGTAVYTAAFTPSTSPLTAITNTSLLTCQSNRFVDNSSNNLTITRNGDVSVRPFSLFSPSAAYSTSTNGGSGYFDGTTDWLQIANNAAFNLGSSDFTIEAWVYPTTSGVDRIIISKNAGSFSTGFEWNLDINTANKLLFNGYGTGYFEFVSTGTIAINCWTHVAAVRNGSTVTLYINGVSDGSGTPQTYRTTTSAVAVGRDLETGGSGRYFTGYISNVRVVKGTAVYTSNFTPPTSPLTAITNTSLLLNSTNAGIIDNAADNVLETVGNAQISTSIKKYGTGSLAFDGTGDWLLTPDSADLRLGTGNFTIEFWLYLGATGAARGVVGKGASTTGWLVSTNSSNNVVFTYGTSTITSTGTLSGSTWYHIAVVRSGTGTNQTKIYIDGTNDGTGTVSTDFTQTEAMYVGANRTGGDALNGYIDDLRITKGIARYTANFTPPTAAFPDL